VKVSYPSVIVQYAARTGVPSFFMHPECFSTYPVDFIRMGKTAYKETAQMVNYVINPERDVVGWDMFPQLHHHFSKCQLPFSGQQETCQATSSRTKLVANRYLEELSGTSEALWAKAETSFKLSVDNSDNKNSAPVDNYEIVSLSKPPESEDNQCYLVDQGQMRATSPKLASVQHSEPQILTCPCSCHSNFSSEAVQWVTPRKAAQNLGISPAILRRLATDRAIPVLRRPNGQRLYNIPGIRKFIDDSTVQPVSLKKPRLRQ
jgi:hypothetical protein